jgi:hypothetical protein
MRLFTLKIDPEECVGDSLAKHNFNLLSLDSMVCNLSSLFFSTFANDIPLESSFNDLSSNYKLFNDNLAQMVNPIRFDIMYTGINLLSSYYSSQELTVQYEFNRYKLDGKPENCSLIVNEGNPTFVSGLIQNSDNYITNTDIYRLSSYPVGSIINVIYPIFSNEGTIVQKYRINKKTSQTEIDNTMQELNILPIYSSTVRSISGYFGKLDNYIFSVPTFRFIKTANDWSYVSTVSSLAGGPVNYIPYKPVTPVVTPVVTPAVTPVVTPAVTPTAIPVVTPTIKPTTTTVATPNVAATPTPAAKAPPTLAEKIETAKVTTQAKTQDAGKPPAQVKVAVEKAVDKVIIQDIKQTTAANIQSIKTERNDAKTEIKENFAAAIANADSKKEVNKLKKQEANQLQAVNQEANKDIKKEKNKENNQINAVKTNNNNSGVGGSGAKCFIRGTKISLPNGKNINIENIEVGCEVLTYNFDKKQKEACLVTNIESDKQSVIIKILLESGKEIISSITHPFYIINKGLSTHDPLEYSKYFPNEDITTKIEIGDVLVGLNQEVYTIKHIETIECDPVDVYNLIINGNQNYYANEILVGN